ncbi:hypothetical protein PV516_18930 [Streptomyces scabiei]|uniref:hypothetical protein n=1 Tax=Streptomyces scabiei TaxID=1930 RepID=UPI0029B7C107|nr:hypothetical protein [Streptomyces scabiei]MDX3165862.1 hypothetical protein [Streptomyces scabiei]
MDVLFFLFAVLVGFGLSRLGHFIARKMRSEPSCTWCSTASGWPVRGHDTLHCRGFVLEQRERHPEYGGNLWRDPADPLYGDAVIDVSRAQRLPFVARPVDPESK